MIKKAYIDTCVVLNYVEDRTDEAVLFVESIKTRGWELRTSTFALTELSDYQKKSLYFWDKLRARKSLNHILKKVRDSKLNRKLDAAQLSRVSAWIREIIENRFPNLAFLDLGGDNAWRWVRVISESSNLSATDAIHLATAFASAANNDCDFFITDDDNLLKEANQLVDGTRLAKKIKIMSTKEFANKYPPRHGKIPQS